MYILPRWKRRAIIHALVEGNSMKGITRMFRVSKPTVATLLVRAGEACEAYHDANVRNVTAPLIECDEIWSYVYAKARNVPYVHRLPPEIREGLPRAGDLWLWTALDIEHRLWLSWHIGGRGASDARSLLQDVRGRVTGVPQITSDSLSHYETQCRAVFGPDVHYSRIVRSYVDQDGVIHEQQPRTVIGTPDPTVATTSHMERLNMTLRTHMRRYTRKTNAFSKRADRHGHLVAIFAVYYNFCKKHETLETTPAVAAGLADEIRDVDWIVELVEANDPRPGPRGPYGPRRRPTPPPSDNSGAEGAATVEAVVV